MLLSRAGVAQRSCLESASIACRKGPERQNLMTIVKHSPSIFCSQGSLVAPESRCCLEESTS
jgi:hypothetical protein